MKPTMEAPSDLDFQARKKWEELVGSLDVDADMELLANYCRTHSNLMAIRREKKKQQKKGKFKATVPGRDGAMVLNPITVGENRMIASLNKMLSTLGLTPSREEQARRGPAPAAGVDPLELALCGPSPEPSAAVIEADRRREANEKLLARNDWRAYERDFDPGRSPRKD